MGKKSKWRIFLICAVLAFSLQQILPTLFYYSKPLKSPVSSIKTTDIQKQIKERLDLLEKNSIAWIHSLCSLLKIEPLSCQLKNFGRIQLKFAKTDDATKFKNFLPAAASQFPFAGGPLFLANASDDPKEVQIQHAVSYTLPQDFSNLFETVETGSERYFKLLDQRKEQLRLATHRNVFPIEEIRSLPLQNKIAFLSGLSEQILEIEAIAKESPEIAGKMAYPIRNVDRSEFLSFFSSSHEELVKQMDQIPPDAKKSLQEKETLIALAEQAIKKNNSWFDQKFKTSSSPFIISIAQDIDQKEFILSIDPAIKNGSKRLQALFMEEITRISSLTGEDLIPKDGEYRISFHTKKGISSLLLFHLDLIESDMLQHTMDEVVQNWKPKHPDFIDAPILNAEAYESLSPEQKAFCLVFTKSPANSSAHFLKLEMKGIELLLHSYEKNSDSDVAKQFFDDLTKLSILLSSDGYRLMQTPNGLVFEKKEPARALLEATREKWKQVGSGSYATLELGTIEERIAEENRIDTSIHEELLRWDDEYKAAQVSLDENQKFTIPKPISNPIWSNLCLYLKKIIRGDESRVLKWGLDLSGGKSIQLELKDREGQVITDEAAIKRAMNELFERVNKLGVSDVSIRQIGNNITLDFPGSDALGATDLVKASSMSFHLVNEKFGPMNPEFAALSERFLRLVWNEAVSTRKTDPENILEIARAHLHESPLDDAKALLDAGLTFLPGAKNQSKVVIARDTGANHPLMIVFHEPVLEGSNLTNIHASYDQSKGNFLSFEVDGKKPQENLAKWTSQYSKEGIAGTDLDFSGRGRGWRMAVVLNGTVISAPSLESPLSSSASISGSFSQREVQKFASDLKAGSLSFTPKILSETSISPELGTAEREQGIRASLIALGLVIVSMVAYYRFAGVIASIAVLCNLVILWAVLQNMGASLSLAGIAGIILTIGMAVDANVLVFERIREEFGKTGKISYAIQTGYDRAFNAILDSNLTTILAALVLLQFDSGPIRAFAVTMIVGIVSSMFTALFMTRTYFNFWASRPESKKLSMASWLHGANINFLKWTKAAVGCALLVTVVGIGSLAVSKSSILSLDFTGGYALRLELDQPQNRGDVVEKALLAAGASASDFQVREIQHSKGVELFLGASLEEEGKPFSTILDSQNRIEWIRSAVQNAGAQISQSAGEIQTSWSAMSGQMSESMRNQALFGLGAALFAIFVYLYFRFEAKYATAALLCIVHDLVVTVAILGLLKACGAPVQIDLTVVAALMTIVGYSLNDTIIVFDRIRENLKQETNQSFQSIVHLSLNETLSRTAMTSGTTLLVILALLIFGGSSIFSFSLVMTVGVVIGTLSSWFIASPLLSVLRSEKK